MSQPGTNPSEQLKKYIQEHSQFQFDQADFDKLTKAEIDLDVFPDMTDAHFKELGFSLGKRIRFKKVIDEMKKDIAGQVSVENVFFNAKFANDLDTILSYLLKHPGLILRLSYDQLQNIVDAEAEYVARKLNRKVDEAKTFQRFCKNEMERIEAEKRFYELLRQDSEFEKLERDSEECDDDVVSSN